MKPEPLGVEVSLTHNMRLTMFKDGIQLSFQIVQFDGLGDNFFVFYAHLTYDLVDYLTGSGWIYSQPSESKYQLSREVEFRIE